MQPTDKRIKKYKLRNQTKLEKDTFIMLQVNQSDGNEKDEENTSVKINQAI